MPQSATLFFTDPAGFVAAVPNDGTSRRLVITGHGLLNARLTWVALDTLRLVAGEETLSRIAFITVPDHLILVVLQRGPYPCPIWGDVIVHPGEMLTFGPGSCAHVRTAGPSRWAAVLVPVRSLARYARKTADTMLAGRIRALRWTPPSKSYKILQNLHAAAIRAVEIGRPELISKQAAHGLDQQILEALVECLSGVPIAARTPTMRRLRDVMVRFESLLDTHDHDNLRVADVCLALGISSWTLGRACRSHLGIGPANYLRLRRKQRVRHARDGGMRRAPGIDFYR